MVQPVSCLQHWLVSDARDKSRRNCIVACYELTCPGEKFLPDPHQLAVGLHASTYITIHAHVFISIYLYQEACDKTLNQIPGTSTHRKVVPRKEFLPPQEAHTVQNGEGKAAEIHSLKLLLQTAPETGTFWRYLWGVLITQLSSISSL